MTNELEESFDRLYENYEDLIMEVEIQDQDHTLGVLISKLEKRLSLIWSHLKNQAKFLYR